MVLLVERMRALCLLLMSVGSLSAFDWPVVATGAQALTAAFGPAATATATATVSGPALVQQKTGTATGNSITVTFDSPAGISHIVTACISLVGVSDILDSTTPTFPMNFSASSVGTGVSVAILQSSFTVGGEAAVDFSLSHGGTGTLNMTIQEWSSVNEAFGAEATGEASANSSSAITSVLDDPPGSTNSLVLAVAGVTIKETYSSGPTGGFTGLTRADGNVGAAWPAYKVLTSPATAATTWTSTSSLNNWASCEAALGAP